MLNIAVIGYGYWGPNIVRNFVEAPGANVLAVCDQDEARLEQAQSRYPGITTTMNPEDLINNDAIDAVAVVTPVATHYDLALKALQSSKHVLVEKPMTATVEQGETLVQEAQQRGLTLMVDHTFVYTGAVRKIQELVNSGELGDVYYYDSTRINLGLFQHDVNVLWDLAVHDLTIMDYVLAEKPIAVSATGISHVAGEPENVAYLTLFFENNMIAHINVNWLAPVKVRSMLIGGSKKMIVFDDLEPSEKLKIYDKGITVSDAPESVYEMLIGYRAGDMWAPKIERSEALRVEALHFVECIQDNKTPLTDGKAGLRVVRILEAANQSMQQQGARVALPAAH
ncbi:MAG: gfo/Idh/MocA family oxidoreductase [Chloroflexi bacterium]|nr:MAG: gfo/Idh/MocA family oxidoreductase [Chloroflexota bacterium]MBL1193194.1 gfo/Idh/MocA family oxidoreductase [Chloroflexota bacterium]NOH10488.1 Gfo/Idh/MocA family oxidoreductase [Chloroflexota bacterium]